jgi:hypothetical protein
MGPFLLRIRKLFEKIYKKFPKGYLQQCKLGPLSPRFNGSPFDGTKYLGPIPPVKKYEEKRK